MKDGGLDDYLILLSISMTCRYKGVSFLKFLLSKSRDVDAFRGRPRVTRRSSQIEMYPKGFDSLGPKSRRAEAFGVITGPKKTPTPTQSRPMSSPLPA